MRVNVRWMILAAALAALSGPAAAQGLLDKGKNGGGGSQGGGTQGGGSQGGGVQSGGGGGSRGGGGGGQQGGNHGGGGGSQGGGSQGGNSGGGLGKGNGGGNSGGGSLGGGSQGGMSQGGGNNGNYGGWSGGGPQNGGVQFGRPDSNRNNGSRGDNNLSKKQSRSGSVQYRTQNNAGSLRQNGNGQGLPSLRIGAAPIGQNFPPGQQGTVMRQDRTRLVYNGWRCGYYAYDYRWCDDYFYYPFYSFDPWGSNCVISPWYYYPNLPGYVGRNRVRTWTIPGIAFIGYPYEWVNPGYNNGGNWNNGWGNSRYNDVDYAVDDLQNAFEEGDRRAAARLVPRRSDVGIFVDGKYSYSLSADDFCDLLLDNIQNTRTRRYAIERVWRSNDGARVIARHEFEDPWGQRCTVWHNVIFQYERNQLVIREFGVSNYRP